MRHKAWAVAIVGILAARVGAGEPVSPYQPTPTYQPAPSFQPGCSSCGVAAGRLKGRADNGGCSACGGGQGGEGRSRDRLGKLIDFLTYRPTPGCDCCPQTTAYVPPLHAWFPPCCHANGMNGCATGCSKCGFKKKGACSTCEGNAGMPMHVGATKPELIREKASEIPARPSPYASQAMTVRPQPPAAQLQNPSRFWMPGIPASGRPSSYPSQTGTQNSDGSRVQPADYLPPLPQR
jgi:hypothetical protein